MNNLRTIKARHANGNIEECSVRIERHPHKLFFSGVGFQEREFSSGDLFDALMLLRIELERMNVQLLCNGARRDVFPSGMCRDMGHGGSAYIMKLGRPALPTDLVDIFDYSEDPSLGSVSEQQDFYRKWRSHHENEIWSRSYEEVLARYLKSKGSE